MYVQENSSSKQLLPTINEYVHNLPDINKHNEISKPPTKEAFEDYKETVNHLFGTHRVVPVRHNNDAPFAFKDLTSSPYIDEEEPDNRKFFSESAASPSSHNRSHAIKQPNYMTSGNSSSSLISNVTAKTA